MKKYIKSLLYNVEHFRNRKDRMEVKENQK